MKEVLEALLRVHLGAEVMTKEQRLVEVAINFFIE
jgi:hypothetical protein